MSLNYYTSTLSEEHASNVLNTFNHVVFQILKNPHGLVKNLNLLSSRDRCQIEKWSAKISDPARYCAHELVRQQCLQQPHASAVCSWDGNFTYAELDKLSSGLASSLENFGVGPEVFVPVFFEKTKWVVVAMLGVIKSGGAFVLLDPSYPIARLKDICEEVNAGLVVASKSHSKTASQLSENVITVDQHAYSWTHNENNIVIKPQTALYVIFTSGTTGKPKGVVIEHASFCASATAHSEASFLVRESRVLQFSSYAYDASILEILTTLIVGGCVCIPSNANRFDDLPKAFNQFDADWALLTPSVARLLTPDEAPCIKTLVLGGEPISHIDVKTWADRVQLVSAYGGTECSIVSTMQSSFKFGSASNIGYTTGGICLIVDKVNHNILVPVGAVGELLIGGPIVGRGYLNDVKKTQASYIDSPAFLQDFQRYMDKGSRFYKTGDLARYNLDGSIMYVGRKDTQTKLRGQRIELAEIEFHIRERFSGVIDVVVEIITPTEQGGNPALAAFIWCGFESSTSGGDIYKSSASVLWAIPNDEFNSKAALAQSELFRLLPSYMVPTLFIALEWMPRSSSGKTDRKRLREEASLLSRTQLNMYRNSLSEKTPPSTEAEKYLQQIWSRLLSLEPAMIGISDSFFDLGGDSIIAMKLVGEARGEGVQLTVSDIFSAPRLFDLALKTRKISSSLIRGPKLPFSLLGDDNTRHFIVSNAEQKCGLPLSAIDDIYPCTTLQEGLMALTVKDAQAYVARFVYDLPKWINLEAFRAAWASVVEANVIMRTRIIQDESGAMFQVVIKHDNLEWGPINSFDHYLEKDSTRPMQLGGALARFAISSLSNECPQYCFVLTIHHALYDGWSLILILQQLEAAYNGKTLEKRLFSHFIDHICHNSYTASKEFWCSSFRNPHSITFPSIPSMDYMPAATASIQQSISLGPKAVGFTMSTLIRLAWAVVVAKYTDVDDVVFGTTVSGRSISLPEIEKITGPTIATVPFRVQMKPEETVSQALRTVQDFFIKMIPYEQTGLRKISGFGPDTAAACHFQNLLIIQPQQETRTSGLLINGRQISEMTAFGTYSITMLCEISTDKIDVLVSFDEQIVEKSQMQSIIHQFAATLCRINEEPNQKLREISIFSPEDTAQLREWNEDITQPTNFYVHEMIHRQCQLRPDELAIDAWDGSLTYRKLDELSSILAAYLINKANVGPEKFVLICFEKSLWTVVAIIAVIKSGGAFVLLDPAFPVNRLKAISESTLASSVITSSQSASAASELASTNIVIPDELADWSADGIDVAHSEILSSNAAYAIFTSGSTGKPKGVVIEHASLAHSVTAHGKAMCLNHKSRALQFSSYAFDASLIEQLTVLAFGGRVCIPSDLERRSSLVEVIHRFRVNWLCLTPSMIRSFYPSEIPTVKTVVLVGEPISKSDVKIWAKCVHLLCGYGPAECSIISSVSSISPTSDPRNLGHATGGTFWIVNKHNYAELAPIGIIGELLIEGPIVGRAYLDDADLKKTRAAFIEAPSWLKTFRRKSQHGKLYKTGDLAQYCSDGTVKYIGRIDTQVKLRGQRIELEEIEYHVRQIFHDVKDVVADIIVPAGEGSSSTLAAFICLKGSPREQNGMERPGSEGHLVNLKPNSLFGAPNKSFRTEANRVELHLSQLLPSYMVPGIFIPLSRVPYMLSGKTDRQQLRSLAGFLSHKELSAYVSAKTNGRPPSTNIEIKLTHLFSRILNLNPASLGIDDSFFRVGGDSISAMQLSARCRAERLHLTVPDIFRHKTISQLALHANKSIHTAIPKLEEVENDPFELSPIQRLFFNILPEGHNHFNQSVFLSLTEPISTQILVAAIEALITRHSMLRARFRKNSDTGEWTQIITNEVQASYRFSARSIPSINDDEREFTEILDLSQKSLDIQHGPLFSVDLIESSANPNSPGGGNRQGKEQYLYLLAHHLVIDYVSWQVLIRELETLLSSTSPLLPGEKPLSFQTWCRLQKEHAQKYPQSKILLCGFNPSTMLDYWGIQNRTNTYAETHQLSFTLPPSFTRSLISSCNAPLRSHVVEILHATLLHSFQKTFEDRRNVGDAPTIFFEGHGREGLADWGDNTIDLAGTLGWFTNIFPCFVEASHDFAQRHEILEILRRTKDSRRRISSNGGAVGWTDFTTPIEILFNYLGLQSRTSHSGPALLLHHLPQKATSVSDIDPSIPRFAIFEVSAVVAHDSSLTFNFRYNRHMNHQHSIRLWVKTCENSLREAELYLSTLQERSERIYTLADFPLLKGWSYTDLDMLTQELPRVEGIKVELEDVYPCSPIQIGILLSQAKDPALYQVRVTWQVFTRDESPVDVQRLKEAWQAVIARHASLRTIFVPAKGKAGGYDQVVLANVYADIDVHESMDALGMQKYQNRKENGQLVEYLPYKVALCTTAERKVFADLQINHALIDAISIAVLLRDVSRAYCGSLASGSGPRYSEYIAHIQSMHEEEARKYWEHYLKGLEPCLLEKVFHTDQDASENNKVEKELRSMNVPLSQGGEKLHKICDSKGMTLSNLFQVAWGLVLRAYTGLQEVCFGYLTSGRDANVEGVTETVGAFINMLVCRMDFGSNPGERTVVEVLKKNQEDFAKGLAFQHCALAEIWHGIGLKEFNTGISLQGNIGAGEDVEEGLCFRPVRGHDPTEVNLPSFSLWRTVAESMRG